ncbi:hypothetical protein [Actinoplanes sp. M2I2]|uniref:hypothetical protein n=1 Tax=Actinoplanes sp. M2I2 TaxID=1734444 RepID=UPI002020F8C4|nr:hypothetical protein [Actinoplanes sp. M2I2]
MQPSARSGFWNEYTAERAITAFLCLVTGLSLGISVSTALDRRIHDTPWLRLTAVAAFLLLACGITIARRNLALDAA